MSCKKQPEKLLVNDNMLWCCVNIRYHEIVTVIKKIPKLVYSTASSSMEVSLVLGLFL